MRAEFVESELGLLASYVYADKGSESGFQLLLMCSCTLFHNTPFSVQLKTKSKQREETIWLLCTDCLPEKWAVCKQHVKDNIQRLQGYK